MKVARTSGYTPRFKKKKKRKKKKRRLLRFPVPGLLTITVLVIVMKLHESDNRGGIAVKTYTKSTCSQYKKGTYKISNKITTLKHTQKAVI